MKKLVIFDHNGVQRFQDNVFMEGQDYKWESATPTAFWIGTIMIIEEKEFNEMRGIKAIEPISKIAYEEEKPLELAPVEEKITEEEAREMQEGQIGDITIEAKMREEEEKANELKEASNISTGNERTNKASKPKVSKAKNKDNTRRTVNKRNK